MDGRKFALYNSVCYLNGKGVSFGEPLIQVAGCTQDAYSVNMDIMKTQQTAVFDKQWRIFADGSLDHVYIGPRLENVENARSFIAEASRKLRTGGHLVVHFNIGKTTGGVTEFWPDTIKAMLASCGAWQTKINLVNEEQGLIVVKKLPGKRGLLEEKIPQGKRACVIRYGALGDAIILTPLLRALKEDGYYVQLNITTYCAPVLENNPFVDDVLIQEKDSIPNLELGDYWKVWRPRYDKYINLCESLEGQLLKVEGRKDFYTPKTWRHETCNVNYYDNTLAKGGYPGLKGRRGELYFTSAEERKAQKFFAELKDRFVILWALNGSSHHKVYPLMQAVLEEFFAKHLNARAITVGDHMARLMEFEHPQLIPRAAQWTIRESLIATKYANLVVGPETVVLNAAGCFSTPKICLLSHSTKENLTKYFENDYSLEPDSQVAPCWPCHQLHYSKESCVIGGIKDKVSGENIAEVPICTVGIDGMRLLNQIEEIYSRWKK